MPTGDTFVDYKSQKQAVCYCDQQAIIQYGLKYLPYVHLGVYPGMVFALVLAVRSSGDMLARALLIFFCCIYLFIVPGYKLVDTRRQMLKAGHSNTCSRKVAVREMFYFGRFSEFAIIEKPGRGGQ